MRGACGLDFAATSEHPADADRAERHGKRQLAPKQRRRRIDLADIAKHPLAQFDGRKLGPIAAHCRFGHRAAIGVVEQETRQAPLCSGAKVFM